MTDLNDAYTGRKAEAYDAVRSRTARWKAEDAAMRDLITPLKPKVVLDCPFGTGRWNPLFDACGATVYGIDISQEMLGLAKNKIPQDAAHRYKLFRASIFDLEEFPFEQKPDLVCCIRFLNWVDFSSVEHALGNISRLGARDLLLGLSVVPKNGSWISSVRSSLVLKVTNGLGARKQKQFVHDQLAFKKLLAALDYGLVSQRFIFRNISRENYFFHFRKES